MTSNKNPKWQPILSVQWAENKVFFLLWRREIVLSCCTVNSTVTIHHHSASKYAINQINKKKKKRTHTQTKSNENLCWQSYSCMRLNQLELRVVPASHWMNPLCHYDLNEVPIFLYLSKYWTIDAAPLFVSIVCYVIWTTASNVFSVSSILPIWSED